jgi:hypothetical protein
MTFPIFTSLKAVSEDYLSYILQRVTPGPESACQARMVRSVRKVSRIAIDVPINTLASALNRSAL